MKRICSVFVAVCMLLTLSVLCVNAEDALLTITNVDVDYGTNQITVECSSTAGYLQNVIVVIYDAEEASPQWDNYVRAAEITTDTSGKCTAKFTLAEDMIKTLYTVEVKGSGKMAAQSVNNTDFAIIPLTGVRARLELYNGAAASELDALLSADKDALELNLDSFYESNKSSYLAAMISMRNEDCVNAKFSDLTQVAQVFRRARVMVEMKNAVTATQIGDILSANASILGINTADNDYIQVKAAANEIFLKQNKDKAVTSATATQKQFGEALALAKVNSSAVAQMDAVLHKYKTQLQIDTLIASYNAMTNANKTTVVRQIAEKNFTDAKTFSKAFSDAIGLIGNEEDTPSVNVPDRIPDSGGGGGGGGGGGLSYSPTEQTPDAVQGGSSSQLFSDLNQFAWATESITALYERGIISGYGDGTFRGNKTVTRSEFVKMVVTAFGLYDESAQCAFSDVSTSDWQYAFVGSAVKNGLIFGLPNGSFGANDAITREDASVVIFRAVNAINMLLEDEKDWSEFGDGASVSDYAREAVTALCKAKVINGFDNGNFEPQGALTRAQSAKIIYELIKRV